MIKFGIDNFDIKNKFKDMKIGLITNSTSYNRKMSLTADLFIKKSGAKHIEIFSPEHGFFGDFQSGETVKSFLDYDRNVIINSLYDEPVDEHNASRNVGDLDERMRLIDSKMDSSKKPAKEKFEGFDAIVFDLQDVGTRIYTYTSTMINAIDTAISAGIKFIVLDRPNPIGGSIIEGDVLDSNYFSFIGSVSVPLRHGLTVGEIANFYNKKVASSKADLDIIKVKGLKRNHFFSDTGYHWPVPSPNMPTLETAFIYTGGVMIEGTNISEGRGTTTPFKSIGSPWLNGLKIANHMNGLHLPGVKVVDVKFIPFFSKYAGKRCEGIRIFIDSFKRFRGVEFFLHLIKFIMETYEQEFSFYDDYFDKVAGNDKTRKMLIDGYDVNEILEYYEQKMNKFTTQLGDVLLYE